MSDLSVSASLLTPVGAAPTAAQAANAARIRKTAEDFETSFLSQMLKPMFEGLSTDGEFTGGQAEGRRRSIMIEAITKKAVKAGGIGLTGVVMSEMLKMQEKSA
jgi:Rod binding domain-containing protein